MRWVSAKSSSRAVVYALVSDGLDDTAHRQVRVLLPPLGELVNLDLQVDVADVACLDDKVVRRREDLEAVDFAQDVSRCESLCRPDDDRDL